MARRPAYGLSFSYCILPLAGAITTLGRGGSDLTATVLGAALELPEVQVSCS